MAENEKLKKLKKIGLAIGIVIVLNVLANVAIDTFYKAEDYEKHCPMKQASLTEEQCKQQGGRWYSNEEIAKPMSEGQIVSPGYCDEDFTCRQGYEAVMAKYNRNVFVVLVLVGMISVIVGISLTAVSAVATGLLYGGILSIIIGTIRYWSSMEDYLRFGLMLVTFVFLIWLGYRKLKD